MLRILNIYVLFLFATSFVWGQDISFKAEAEKTEISVNERLFVQFILISKENIQLDKPMELPKFEGLQHLGASQVNKVQYINGEVTKLFGVESVLVADRVGEYTIGPAIVTINGKQYKTQPIKIKVTEGLKPKVEGGQRMQGAFLTTEVSNSNPYVNQETVIVVKAFARDYSILQRLRNYQEPDFTNLVTNYVSEQVRDHEKQVLVEGRTFISKEIARYVVFPQKSGEIKIDPFSVDVLISGHYGAETIMLSSDPIQLNVKNLPEGRPKNFSGAIGEYTMNTNLSKKNLKSEESINLEIEIVGSGNLNTLKMPEIDLPEHIETYAPRKRENFEARPSGLRGKVVETLILVPQYGGDYKIDPITFSYFDPEKNEYINLKSKSFNLKVDGPPPPVIDTTQLKDEVIDSITTENAIDTSNPSIFKPNIDRIRTQVSDKVSTANYNWIWIVIGLVLLGFIFLLWPKNSNKKPLSSKQLEREFKKDIDQQLKQLKSLTNDKTAFLSLEEEVLTQIGMHYSQTQLADFTEESVAEKLTTNHGERLAGKWKELLLDCKQSKYALGGDSIDLNGNYKALHTFWKSISK